MTKSEGVVALIPARAGSKGIPNKNITPLGGKPLMVWSIEAAKSARFIEAVYVSSDSHEIREIGKSAGANIQSRPAWLAEDDTLTQDVVRFFLDSLEDRNKYSTLVLLQPTSPFRGAADIDDALALYSSSDAEALISVCEPEHHPYKAFIENEQGGLEGIINNEYPFMPRQSLPTAFIPNGAIYIVSISAFLRNTSFFQEKTLPFLMPQSRSVDIDTISDLERAEQWIQSRNIDRV